MTRAAGVTVTAVIGPDGTGVGVYTVPQDRHFTLERMAATGPRTDLPGKLRVYLSGELLDHTRNPAADISALAQPVGLAVSDQIRAEWSECTPGVTMRLALSGTQ